YYTIALHLYLKALSIFQHFKHSSGELSIYAMFLRLFTYCDYVVIGESSLKLYATAAFDLINHPEDLSERVLGDIYFALAEFEFNINCNYYQAQQYFDYAYPYLSKFPDYNFFSEFLEFKSKLLSEVK
ncbi:MAG: hypothetical protein JWQ09_4679, partial [Segetibacter sp.]|nr:hypothetical protein [Segetibacter sp.]